MYPSNPVNVINNIDIVKYITSLINVDLDKISNELYVDVTEQGTYDSASEIFTFKDNDIKIKRNTSTASVHGINIELSGEVALYIEGRFYVPQRIFTLEDQIVDGMVVQADYKTGRIFYSGNIGKQNAQLPVTVAITKPNAIDMEEENILAIDQLTTHLNGTFTFEGTVDRLAGNYTIYTNYSDGSDRPLMINFALKNTIPLMTVKRNNTDITKIGQVKAGDEINITLSGFDLTSDYPGVIITAQYVDGMLSSTRLMPAIVGSSNIGSQISKSINVVQDADKIVIYYWNQNTYAPLIASYTID